MTIMKTKEAVNSLLKKNEAVQSLLKTNEVVPSLPKTKDAVRSLLNSKLNPIHLEVLEKSGGCDTSFDVVVVSDEFIGKKLLERHRMVYSVLEEVMGGIHALSLKTMEPDQWKPPKNE